MSDNLDLKLRCLELAHGDIGRAQAIFDWLKDDEGLREVQAYLNGRKDGYAHAAQVVAEGGAMQAEAALEPTPAAVTEPQIPEGFTKWEGGECPVPFCTRVAVIYRKHYGELAHEWKSYGNADTPETWTHDGSDSDIIAYRIIEAPAWASDLHGTSPGEAEESRDQLCSVEGCETHADDASEFAEEGYAPVTKPYRVIADEDYERVTYDFATMAEATACYDEFAAKPIARVDLYVLHEDGHGLQEWVKHSSFCKPASLVEAEQTREPVALAGEWVGMPDREHPAFIEPEPLADPIWNEPEPEPTKPEADALAKAADYYSPEAVAERNKFNPFGMFKREGDQ